jgi:hypothetical protein
MSTPSIAAKRTEHILLEKKDLLHPVLVSSIA